MPHFHQETGPIFAELGGSHGPKYSEMLIPLFAGFEIHAETIVQGKVSGTYGPGDTIPDDESSGAQYVSLYRKKTDTDPGNGGGEGGGSSSGCSASGFGVGIALMGCAFLLKKKTR